MRCIVLLAIIVALAGCSDPVANAPSRVPLGAMNITNLGNDWVLFDLVINGKVHSFLYRRVGSADMATETITEVSR